MSGHVTDWVADIFPLEPSFQVRADVWLWSGRPEATESLNRNIVGPAVRAALQRYALKEAKAAEAAHKPKEKTIIRRGRKPGFNAGGKKKRRRRR